MSKGLSVGCAQEVKQNKQAMIQQAVSRSLKDTELVKGLRYGIKDL
jgi:hypothetical protein